MVADQDMNHAIISLGLGFQFLQVFNDFQRVRTTIRDITNLDKMGVVTDPIATPAQ
jgi:hypothetical protein